MSYVPCTPPLLLLGLSQNLVHLSPQLWDFIMCTLVHWYTGTLDIVYPGYIASGTLVHLYPGTLSCTMYPCTPPLLLLGLSQNFGTSFTPTLRIYYMNFFLKTKIFPKPPENIYTMYGNIYFNIWVNLVWLAKVSFWQSSYHVPSPYVTQCPSTLVHTPYLYNRAECLQIFNFLILISFRNTIKKW